MLILSSNSNQPNNPFLERKIAVPRRRLNRTTSTTSLGSVGSANGAGNAGGFAFPSAQQQQQQQQQQLAFGSGFGNTLPNSNPTAAQGFNTESKYINVSSECIFMTNSIYNY